MQIQSSPMQRVCDVFPINLTLYRRLSRSSFSAALEPAAALLGTAQGNGAEAPERKFMMKNGTKKHSEKQAGSAEQNELLGRLDAASKRLNAAADEATSRIQALEERLVDAEPGITVWGATLVTEPATFRRDETSPPEAAERIVTLGFAKVKKDKWGIAVREVFKATNGRLLAEESSLLSRAERTLRLAAVPYLESLTRLVVEAVEAQSPAPDQSQIDREQGTPIIGDSATDN